MTAGLDYAIADMAHELKRLKAKVAMLERGARSVQLDNASIEAGALTINDADGNPAIQIGLQDDGTFAHLALNASDPAAPSDPIVTPGIGGLYVIWDGLMQDASEPLADFDYVQVNVSPQEGFTPDSTTVAGRLKHEGMYAVGGLSPDVPYYVLLVPINTAGTAGDISNEVTGTPSAVPDNIPNGAITGLMIGSGEVTGDNIAANAVTAVHIAAGEVVSGIVDATVINATIINGSVFNGVNFTLDVQGERYYSGYPQAGNLALAISPAAYTDFFGNTVPRGFLSQVGTAQVIVDQAMVQLSSDGVNYTTFQADAKAWPQMVSGGGLTQNVAGNHPANVSPAAITTTGTHDIGSAVTISALDMETGAIFEWYATGSFSTGTTPSSATFTFQIGGSAQATLAVPTITAGLTNAGWWCKARMSIMNGGASGQVSTFLEVGWHTATGVNGSAYWFVVNGTTPSLGSARSMGIQFAWGTVPGATALNPDIQTYGRIA